MRDCRCRRLRYASPTVNKVSPFRGFSLKSRRDGTLLTVGEVEGVTCGSNNCYILFISHLLTNFWIEPFFAQKQIFSFFEKKNH
jgi:hypothetical protein